MQLIENYAIIGNGRSAALISNEGSIDWLCWPRFDSPSIFGCILDTRIGGRWKIAPKLPAQSARQYIRNTNILQTSFTTPTGKIVLTDLMVAISEEERASSLHPEHELIRQISCEEGEVEIEILFQPAPNYGEKKANLKDAGLLGLRLEIGRELFSLHTTIKFDLSTTGAKATVKMKKHDHLNFSFSYSSEAPAVLPSLENKVINKKIKETIHWWQEWSKPIQYSGPYIDLVIRSALTLKLLGYAPSGAFVAAPTTSLPERIGGDLNWDYRFCWLRDASFTVYALLDLGYFKEAEAFVNWMLHSTRLTLPRLNVVYDVFGNRTEKEKILSFLKGYQNSFPVRIGNAAQDQFQLDIYGEVVDGVFRFVNFGGKLDNQTKSMLRRIGEYICRHWQERDSGIWEERDHFESYTFSKLLCWVALDRLLKMQVECKLSKKNIKEFQENRLLIREQIEEKAWNSLLDTYVSTLNGTEIDATLLLMPYFGFEEATSIRMQKTFKKIEEKLSAGKGLVFRHEKSINNEGAFLICSFWKVDFLMRAGDKKNANKAFQDTIQCANDLGLFSEEIDPKNRNHLGNFPQAFTHLGLIVAALSLKEGKL